MSSFKNRTTGQSDTPPHVEKIQIELLRKANSARKATLTFSLSQTVINLSKRALKRSNPGLSEFELKILWVKNCYGPGLAERVRQRMLERNMYESQ